MRFWIDCEFNSFKGELISMALVGEDDQTWYQSLGCAEPHPWVAQHVMPIIGIEPITREAMCTSLQDFLQGYQHVHLVADWPEDITLFCQALITGPGTRINTPPLTMEIRRDLDARSAVPHNALADAQAIRARHLALEADSAWERLLTHSALYNAFTERGHAARRAAALARKQDLIGRWAKLCAMARCWEKAAAEALDVEFALADRQRQATKFNEERT